MVCCSVFSCKRRSSTSNLREHGVSYHLFPKDPILREKWRKFCGNSASWIPTRTSAICSVHFTTESFEVLSNERRILVNGAVPSLDLSQPTINDNLLTLLIRNRLQTKLSYSKKENHTYIAVKHIDESNDVADNEIHNKNIYVFNVNIEPEDNNDKTADKSDFDHGGQVDGSGETEKKCELVIDDGVIFNEEPNLESDEEMCQTLDIRPDEIVGDAKEVTTETNTTKKAKQKSTKKEKKKVDRRFIPPRDIVNDFEIENFTTEEEQRIEFQKRRMSQNYLESKFRCENCLKGFREQNLLTLHMKKHDKSSGDNICKICQIRFSTRRQYRTHRDLNHLAKYTCKRCDFYTFSKPQARYHKNWHEGVEHKCPHCDMTFRKYTTFMGHIRLVHPSQHICGTCAHSFVNEYGLNHHRKVVHKDQEKNCEDSDKTRCTSCDVVFDCYKIYIKHLMIAPVHADIAKTIIACRDCGAEFDNKELLNEHVTKHKKDDRNYNYNMSLEERKQKLKCPQCNKQFSHHTSVYHHFVREHPGIPYSLSSEISRKIKICLCEECGKTFNCRSKLVQHKRLHTGERPYVCNICQKTFRTSVHLGMHRNVHTEDKKFVCQICMKAYSSASNLFKHKRIHERVKLFKCNICGKEFVDSSNLRQHIQGVHHNVRRNRRR